MWRPPCPKCGALQPVPSIARSGVVANTPLRTSALCRFHRLPRPPRPKCGDPPVQNVERSEGPPVSAGQVWWRRPLNEGRPGGAGNPWRTGRGRLGRWALNEGRPGGAGNPTTSRNARSDSMRAQRRPARWGRQPREELSHGRADGGGRSTKAGPVGPATPTGYSRPLEIYVSHRSTKAGPVGPATLSRSRRRGSWPPPLNEGRPGGAGNPASCCVGDRARWTAQRRPARWGRQPLTVAATPLSPPLAQRRPARWGRQPPTADCPFDVMVEFAQRRPARWGRQPWADRPSLTQLSKRSTKAGPVGPATPADCVVAAQRLVDRSTKAGPVGPATLIGPSPPGHHPNRSTKAGPVGPATQVRYRLSL